MIRLETVEDFEKVRKALRNMNIPPRFYCICPYSYCFHCKEVNEFEAPMPYCLADAIKVKCLGCSNFFVLNDFKYKNDIFWGFPFLDINLFRMFKDQVDEMKKLNSREMQAKFFAVELEKRIAKEKSELRKVQNRIHKFAKLRG